ncbi:DUF4179 domain-containing protein [Sporosarcina sp. ACRSL]|uniref:DUF4179 domain-containing protein n=1 Tax=Sporosarcina sp. ACRSL TaxID=2918215 RepID=UPI001EF6137C|nr:DUF4179 domain-containing protein [Sporosarcina sp. ACRSL]MCG7343367.1 DUF4179 domain-containing protein [Sporosarcina sp. ACRSL]
MNEIEKRLAEEHERLNKIKAPNELEGRLRQALDKVPRKKKLKPKWPLAVAALLFVCLVGYNYNGLAYYGKKIIGFDEVMSGTLAELNEQGMGQTIGKQVLLEDGTELTVDGIMTDANQLILYYTLMNSEDNEGITFASIKGFLTNSSRGAGTSIINEEQSEIKGQMFFDPVNPFAKTLTLEATKLTKDGRSISGSISFPYDPNKAMQSEIQQKINQTVKVDKGTITFKAITATPTVTIIKGTMNVGNLSRINLPFEKVELRANGKSVEMMGSGITTKLGGTTFELRYDALPKELDSLDLVVKEFVGYTIVDEKIPLSTISEHPFLLKGEDLWVRDVVQTKDSVEITIASNDDILFDGVTIEGEGSSTPLETTVGQDFEKLYNGRILKVRTLVFPLETTPDYMHIKGMHHMKPVDYKIEIPVK